MKKRKTMRKAVSWFLTVSLFVSAFSFPAFAETKEENTHQVTFVINDRVVLEETVADGETVEDPTLAEDKYGEGISDFLYDITMEESDGTWVVTGGYSEDDGCFYFWTKNKDGSMNKDRAYRWNGWEEYDFTQPVTKDITIEGDLSLVVRTGLYDENLPKQAQSAVQNMPSQLLQKMVFGELYTLLGSATDHPTLQGYEFMGWRLLLNQGQGDEEDDDPVFGNTSTFRVVCVDVNGKELQSFYAPDEYELGTEVPVLAPEIDGYWLAEGEDKLKYVIVGSQTASENEVVFTYTTNTTLTVYYYNEEGVEIAEPEVITDFEEDASNRVYAKKIDGFKLDQDQYDYEQDDEWVDDSNSFQNVYVTAHDHVEVYFYYLEDPGIVDGGDVPDVGE